MYPGPNCEHRGSFRIHRIRTEYSILRDALRIHQDTSGYIRIHQDTVGYPPISDKTPPEPSNPQLGPTPEREGVVARLVSDP